MSTYRKPWPYRSGKTYRGEETAPGVPPPGITGRVAAPWRVATPRQAAMHAPWADAVAHRAATLAPFGAGTPHAAQVVAEFADVTRHDQRTALPFGDLRNPIAESVIAPWGTPRAHGRRTAFEYADTSLHLADGTLAPWGSPEVQATRLVSPWGTHTPRAVRLTALWRAAAKHGALIALPWGPLGARRGNYEVPWPNEPNPGDGDPITVPIRPVYIMIPTVTACLLPSREPLLILSARITTDADSWCWSFSAQIPFSELAKVNPADREDPQPIEVSINGYVWTFLVEGFDDGRRFGGRTASIKGRSRSAYLDEPYAPRRSRVQTADRNPAQLGDEALSGTGWSLLWDAVDWLVPGGTYSAQDATVIDELTALASAIGARLETARDTFDLAVRPRYPVSPWEWDETTPFAILPANILTQASGSWAGGTDANGIYVYSGASNFGAHVKIAGTGGEVQAPMVVERLLTHADPARERGRFELAKAGRSKPETISMPLFPSPAAPGLIPLGTLLQVDEIGGTWRGQCTGITIDAQRSGAPLSVRQHLTIERQFR